MAKYEVVTDNGTYIVETEDPPPPKPPEPSALGKFATAFGETSGLTALLNVMGARRGTPESVEKAKQTIQALWEGIRNEPTRVMQELDRINTANSPGTAAYHLAGAVPFIGSGAQMVFGDIERGDPATALGHTAGIAAPFAAKGAGRLAGAAVERAVPIAQAAGEVTTAAARGAAAEALAPSSMKLGKIPVSIPVPRIVSSTVGGKVAGSYLAGPVGGAVGSVIGAAVPIVRGAVQAGREALKARAAAAAEALETESAAAAAQPAVEIIPPERQLGPGPIITPPPADTSFVRSVPAQVAEVLPEGPLRDRPGASGAALALREAMGLGPDEFRPPAVEAPDFAAVARSGQIDRMAQKLREAGIGAGQAMLLDPPDLAMLAKAGGIEGEPLGVTGRDLVVRLKELEKPKRALEPRKPAAPAAVAAPAPAAPAMTPAEAEAALAKEYPRPATVETAPAPTAAETRIEKIAQTLAGGGIPTADLAGIEALPDGALWIEKLSRSLNLARPGAGEIPKIVERVRQIRGEPLQTVQKGAGEAAFQEQQARITPAPQATITPDAGETVQRPAVSGEARPLQTPRPAVAGTAPGTETTIRIPGEQTTYQARYSVRELDDVHPSHNPHSFQPNPQYQLRNDRNYGDPGNQERIIIDSQPGRFASEYLITDSPDAVNGAPVIDQNGNVLGGNSRAMKLARVYANNPQDSAAYRALLEQQAQRFGIDPAQVRGMKRPVLVRELSHTETSPQKIVTDLNKSGTAALTAAEQATADARRMSAGAADYLGKVIEAEGQEATLNDVLSGKSGAKIINQLVEDGVFTMQEKPKLIDAKTGAVTTAAKERIAKMLLGQVFADSEQMMRTPAEIRNKLERIVSPLLQSGQKAGFDILPLVRESLDLMEYARSHGITQLSDALAQESMFGDAPKFSQQAAHLGQFLMSEKPTSIARAFRRYVSNAEPTMFGASTPEEAFFDAFAGNLAPAQGEALFQDLKAKTAKRKPAQ